MLISISQPHTYRRVTRRGRGPSSGRSVPRERSGRLVVDLKQPGGTAARTNVRIRVRRRGLARPEPQEHNRAGHAPVDIRRRKGRGREDHNELLSGDAARQAQEEGASMHAVAGWGGMSSGDDAAPNARTVPICRLGCRSRSSFSASMPHARRPRQCTSF